MGLFDFAKNFVWVTCRPASAVGAISPAVFSTTDEKAPVEGYGMMTRAWGHL